MNLVLLSLVKGECYPEAWQTDNFPNKFLLHFDSSLVHRAQPKHPSTSRLPYKLPQPPPVVSIASAQGQFLGGTIASCVSPQNFGS